MSEAKHYFETFEGKRVLAAFENKMSKLTDAIDNHARVVKKQTEAIEEQNELLQVMMAEMVEDRGGKHAEKHHGKHHDKNHGGA